MSGYHDQSKWKICVDCVPAKKKPKPVAKHTVRGAQCYNCNVKARNRDPSTHRLCSRCGRKKIVHARDKKKQPVCESCWRPVRRPPKPKRSLRMVDPKPDPTWRWCVDCQAPKPKVIVYGDKQGRCPEHGLQYLHNRKRLLEAAG